MSGCWPDPPDAESLFAAAVLAFGPVPKKGFSKARDPDLNTVVYTTVRGRAARTFNQKIVAFFHEQVREEFPHKDWSDGHRRRIAQRWKNQFYRWLWAELADSSPADHKKGRY